MSYVKHILLPHENILYDGHVHPRVLVPGLISLGAAAWLVREFSDTGHWHSVLMGIASYLAQLTSSMGWFYNAMQNWQATAPQTSLDVKIVALCLAGFGFYHLTYGYITMRTTELIVTDERIIAKFGVFEVTTLEMDRHRVSGVTIYTPFLGRLTGYGYVYIQGFTNAIGGLPPLVNPHLLERFVN